MKWVQVRVTDRLKLLPRRTVLTAVTTLRQIFDKNVSGKSCWVAVWNFKNWSGWVGFCWAGTVAQTSELLM